MSEILAYGWKRNPRQLEALGASRVYVDGDGLRGNRGDMIRDLRPGDVVRVLYMSDLGGAQWRYWLAKIEAKGALVEAHEPEGKPLPPGRPIKHYITAAVLPQARAAWCHETDSLDMRLAKVSAIIGRELTRADRHWLYQRFGKPGAPKHTPDEEGQR